MRFIHTLSREITHEMSVLENQLWAELAAEHCAEQALKPKPDIKTDQPRPKR